MAELGSYGHACELAGVKDAHCLVPRYFDLPLLAFIVDSGGVPVWAPTLYLAHCAVHSRSVTGDTVRSYAEALLVWLAFLERARADLRSVTEDTLAAFRNQLVNRPNERTGRTYASATANHRITVVCAFHLWAQKHGVIESSLGTFLEARSIELTGRSRRCVQRGVTLPRPLTPIVLRRLPRALSYDEIRLLFQVALPPYHLIFKWALLTGLRRFEICKLTIGELPTLQQLFYSRDGFVQINLRRKGSKELTVHVPVKLIEETRWYLLTDRALTDVDDTAPVFLGRRGDVVSRNSVSRAFRKCADTIGTDATFHHLRHTFAVHVLKNLDSAEAEGHVSNSLKTLQVLMGHASVESTETYLRAMEASSDAVMNALDYLYGATL